MVSRGWWMLAALLGLSSTAAAWSSAWSHTIYDLREWAYWIDEYHAKFGVYPTNDPDNPWWRQLVVVSDWPHEPEDHWGLPLIFDPSRPDSTGRPMLRSMGDNGVDDFGAGDDLVFDRPVNDGYYWKSGWPAARRFVPAWLAGFVCGAAVLACAGRLATLAGIAGLVLYLSIGGMIVAPMICTPIRISGAARTINGVSAFAALVSGVTLVTCCVTWMIREDRRRARGRCIRCGYDLAGLPSARCPECGLEPRAESAEDSWPG